VILLLQLLNVQLGKNASAKQFARAAPNALGVADVDGV